MITQSLKRLINAFVLILLLAISLQAQTLNSEAFAIKNATVFPVSGAPIQNGVVIIRNGLIEAVGSGISIPADARVIDAAGMMVYPGLIDAYSNYGIKPPTPPTIPAGANPQQAFLAQLNAGPSTVGMQPEVSVMDQLQVTEQTFDPQRSIGLTAALTAPRDGIFQGRSAFINLGSDASDKLLLKAPVTLNIQFVTGRGGFPNSLMGTFAYLRQMLLDAQHYRDEWDFYSKSPRGKTRPEHNKSLEALIPVINGKMPVIFSASSVREIKRAVALAEEFNLKYFLAGATQSYQITDYLKSKNATVLLSLSFPQKPSNLDDPEDEALRTMKERAEAPKAAAALYKAGIRFAFTSGSLIRPADFITNAERAVEAGLPREEALKALTLYPAQIFGVSEQLGSIEKGKIANLIVTTGDLFNKDTKVKFTFVDGKQFAIKAPEALPRAGGEGRPFGRRLGSGAAPEAGTPPVAATGIWNLVINSPSGTYNSTLAIQQNGEALTGEIGSPTGNVPVNNGKLVGNEISFTYTITFQGQQLQINARGKIEGNAINGSMETVGTTFDFNGTRKPQ